MGWFFLVGSILIFSIVYLLEFLFFSVSKKEEKEDLFIDRTHAPKRRTITSLIITVSLVILFVTGLLVILLTEQDCDLGFWIVFTLSGLFIISIPLILLLICINDYEVIRTDGIIIHRIFKTKFVKYEEMKKYKYSFNQLTVYDKSEKIIFLIADNRVGIKSIIKELEYHGINRY